MPSAEVLKTAGVPEQVQYTTSNGAPYNQPYESQSVRLHPRLAGNLALQDFHLIDLLAHL